MTLAQYLKLLDWTGRQLHKDKAGKIPAEFETILERLDCSAESWLRTSVNVFGPKLT